MSWQPPKDEIDSASMRGEIYYQYKFIEIIVEGSAGELKSFTATQCAKIAAFAKSCVLPVRITMTRYKPGTGMAFKYRSNKRRPCLVPDRPDDQVWFFEGVPKDKKERIEKMKSLTKQGLKMSIVADLFGCSRSNVYKFHRSKDKPALHPATVAVHHCA